MLVEATIVGGLLYTGKVIRKKKVKARTPKLIDIVTGAKALPGQPALAQPAALAAEQKHKVAASAKEVDRKLAISAISTALSAAGALFYPPLALCSIPGLIYTGADIFKSAYQALVTEKKLTTDTTIAVIMVACIAQNFLFVCNLNTLLAMVSRKLLLKVKNDSRNDIIDVFRQQPQKAWVLADGVEIEKSVETLQRGEVIVVNAGETIPADGYICFGNALVDQHILTGESQPAEKGMDEKVFALTLVLAGRIGIRVENAGQQTTAAQIGQILNQTTNLKTEMQLWAEKTGDKAVLPVMLLSAACLPIMGSSSALAILNSHPKYKTTITTYIGVLNFLSIASRQGILIKDGRVFELLNKVDTIVFDKTGTLTENKMCITQIHACDGYAENEIMTLAALAEKKQTHPIARAILQEAGARQLALPEADETEYKIGYGLTVKKQQELIRVGSLRFMEKEGVTIPASILATQEACRQQGHSLVLVAVNANVIGGIELKAVVRPEAEKIIKGLRQRQIKAIYLLSGDHEAPTKRLALALGADHYFAEVLPNHKADIIEQLQQEGRTVCFVGDGINDSIALKKADVSVSLRGASTAATDTAQVILMDESLHRFCTLFDLAREYDVNMKRTFIAVLIPHFIGLGGALFFHFGLLHSVIFNQIGLLLGAGNALLPRMQHHQTVADDRLTSRYTTE
ncbi:MAG: heavy metal translocating P-type ATPase [Caldilinea sp. CFX5]|nr:heavy metal translocating P-type ATPase [Caldilinea sp. CFX5]